MITTKRFLVVEDSRQYLVEIYKNYRSFWSRIYTAI